MHTKQKQTERKTCKNLRRNNSRSSKNFLSFTAREETSIGCGGTDIDHVHAEGMIMKKL